MKIFGEKLKSIIDVCIQKTNKNEKPLKRTKLMMNENEKKKIDETYHTKFFVLCNLGK